MLSTLTEWQQYVVSFTSSYTQREKWKLVAQSLFEIPWTIAHQAPLSMEFSRQEYWSGLPFPSPGDLPNPGIESQSPSLQADSSLFEPSGKHKHHSFYLSPMYGVHHWTLLIHDQKIKAINSCMSKLTLCKIQPYLDNRITSIWTPNVT